MFCFIHRQQQKVDADPRAKSFSRRKGFARWFARATKPLQRLGLGRTTTKTTRRERVWVAFFSPI
jgi:hypothetical protein